MATAEATNELLYSLDHDPIRWKRTDGVPVFRPHERKIGDQTIKVTAADLGKIAEKANNDIAESGKLPTFTLGHRKFGAVDESEQPELLGFYKNFRVTEITRNGQKFPALVADEYAAAAWPTIRPKTSNSMSELPPRRFAPCSPEEASPMA